MQHFGFNFITLFLTITLFSSQGCAAKKYSDDDMVPLTTLSRIVLDVVRANYIGKDAPAEIDEDSARAIIESRGRKMEVLDQLDKYDLKIVSNGKKFGSVFWDPGNDRKLIEDLRCTKKVDRKVWKEVVYGNEFTLKWENCHN